MATPTVGNEEEIKGLYQKYMGEGYVPDHPKQSLEYKIFKKYKKSGSMVFYERIVRTFGSILKLEISEKEKKEMNNHIALLDLDVKAEEVTSASVVLLLLILFPSMILILFNMVLALGGILCSVGVYMFVRGLPSRFVEQRKVSASGEIVLAVLYVVTYMRHSSNLEAAVKFAADNLRGPLSKDFVKLLWDVEAKKYGSVSEALEPYLAMWKDVYPSFVDAMYLVKSVLFQTDENYRMSLLDEAVNRVLDGTYTNMTHYATSLRNPINTIYMMGIVLPVLGMVVFPMITSIMAGSVPTEGLIVMYNIALPIFVYMFVRRILKKRPSGFPHPTLEEHPDVPKANHFFFRGRQIHVIIPTIIAFLILVVPSAYLMSTFSQTSEIQVYVSLVPIFGIALSIYLFTKLSSSRRMQVLNEISEVEHDFAHAVFQLGSLLSQDTPAEQAIMKVADSMKGSATSHFFGRIVSNIRNLGMSFQDAIFDRQKGAVWYYPSPIIKSTMEILLETSRKSLKHAGVSMIFVSRYLRNLSNIDRKVSEILDEVLSSMHFQVVFLSPIISGIVVGMTTLITMIMGVLSERILELSELLGSGGDSAGAPSVLFLTGIFNMTQSTPLGVFQIMVGIYTIQVIIIIAYTIANIERVGDPTYRNAKISSMMLLPIIIYASVTSIMTLMFTGLAGMAIGVTGIFGG